MSLLAFVALLGCDGSFSTGGPWTPPSDGGPIDAGPWSGLADSGSGDGGLEDGDLADSGPPAPVAPPPPIRVAVISDLNGSYGSTTYGSTVTRAVDAVIAMEPDLVLSTGDMVAGQRAGLDYEGMWDAFHAAVSDPLREVAIPFAVTPGNHDASGYSGFVEERAIFVDEWTARRPEVSFIDDRDYPLRYSFEMGPALFISLDDTLVGALSGEQMAWLDEQLRVGADLPVKIVFGHVPLYPFALDREDDMIGDPALEALLVEHGVDLFLSGHHHAYYPGRRGSLRLVSMACQGAGPRALIGESSVRGRSVVAFEVSEEGIVTLDAFGGSDYAELVDRTSLPESVGTGAHRIDRDDL